MGVQRATGSCPLFDFPIRALRLSEGALYVCPMPAQSRTSRPESDPLWQMLSAELGQPEIDELRRYLAGELSYMEMGYGALSIEPYDGRGGRSPIFIVRHEQFGEERVARSALASILHDLGHHLRRRSL